MLDQAKPVLRKLLRRPQTKPNLLYTFCDPDKSTLLDRIFTECGPLELCRLRRTSRLGNELVTSYMSRVYQLPRILLPFLDDGQIAAFKSIQVDTNCVISGSYGLQFFERTRWEEDDLEIFVQRTSPPGGGVPIGELFLSAGYNFQAGASQLPDFYDAYCEAGSEIYTFEKTLVNGKVRRVIVRASRRPVMAYILGLHSTCVMNLITRFTAICLFPVETLHRHRSMVIADPIETRRMFYARGWKMVRSVEEHGLTKDAWISSDYLPRIRRVGDHRSWVIPLVPEDARRGKRELYLANSFKANTFIAGGSGHLRKPCNLRWSEEGTDRFRYKYTSDPEGRSVVRALIKSLHLKYTKVDLDRSYQELDEILGSKLAWPQDLPN